MPGQSEQRSAPMGSGPSICHTEPLQRPGVQRRSGRYGVVPATAIARRSGELARGDQGAAGRLCRRGVETHRRTAAIHQEVLRGRFWVALHMHAGDGNVHTNIPVNSDNYEMLQEANAAVARIMRICARLMR